MFIKLFVLLVLVCKSYFSQNSDSRILGGKPIRIQEVPFFVQVLHFNGFGLSLCGGSIIRRQVVLTAAHCVEFGRPKGYAIIAGSDTIGQGSRHKIRKIVKHENYMKSSKHSYDIALMFLLGKFIYSTTVKPIKLISKRKKILKNQSVLVVGLGQNKLGKLPGKLQGVNLSFIDNKTCKTYIKSLNLKEIEWDASQFCLGDLNRTGKDTCFGDSGGPILFDKYQIGITSWGMVCGSWKHPGVYTRISYVLQWIKEQIRRYPK